VSRNEKLSGGEVLGWSLAGLTAGLLGGTVLAAWLGRGNRRRLKRAINQWRPAASSPRNIATPARSTQAALDGSSLSQFGIEAIGVMAGVVELHGWVPNRSNRAAAARIAAEVPGIDRVVNCILVRGEDDKGAGKSSLADQSA
jgi:hypothetical protein